MKHVFLHCRCGEVIIKSLESDTKIRSKIVVFKNGAAYAVCKSCDAEVKVPLQLDNDMLKSMSNPKSIPLYIKKK